MYTLPSIIDSILSVPAWIFLIVIISIISLVIFCGIIFRSFLHITEVIIHISIRLYSINLCLFVGYLIALVLSRLAPLNPSIIEGFALMYMYLSLLFPHWLSTMIFLSITFVTLVRFLHYLQKIIRGFWNKNRPNGQGDDWFEVLDKDRQQEVDSEIIYDAKKKILIWGVLGITLTLAFSALYSVIGLQQAQQTGFVTPFHNSDSVELGNQVFETVDVVPVLDSSVLVQILDTKTSLSVNSAFFWLIIGIPSLIFAISVRNAMYVLERRYYSILANVADEGVSRRFVIEVVIFQSLLFSFWAIVLWQTFLV